MARSYLRKTISFITNVHIGVVFFLSRYVSKRVFATAPDKTQIPISMIHRRDLYVDSANNIDECHSVYFKYRRWTRFCLFASVYALTLGMSNFEKFGRTMRRIF